MKAKNFSFVLMMTIFFSGCVVYSFYPLYTEKDLFPNEILTGKWVDSDSTLWNFEHAYNGKENPANIDSTSYILYLKEKNKRESKFRVHIVQLSGHYFLDFYLEDFPDDNNLNLASFHIVPVHTFAKLEASGNRLKINWFNQDWLKKLIEANKIRIHHEDNGDYILLTAKPGELQKFVTKYVNSEEAFKDGIEAQLKRM